MRSEDTRHTEQLWWAVCPHSAAVAILARNVHDARHNGRGERVAHAAEPTKRPPRRDPKQNHAARTYPWQRKQRHSIRTVGRAQGVELTARQMRGPCGPRGRVPCEGHRCGKRGARKVVSMPCRVDSLALAFPIANHGFSTPSNLRPTRFSKCASGSNLAGGCWKRGRISHQLITTVVPTTPPDFKEFHKI